MIQWRSQEFLMGDGGIGGLGANNWETEGQIPQCWAIFSITHKLF